MKQLITFLMFYAGLSMASAQTINYFECQNIDELSPEKNGQIIQFDIYLSQAITPIGYIVADKYIDSKLTLKRRGDVVFELNNVTFTQYGTDYDNQVGVYTRINNHEILSRIVLHPQTDSLETGFNGKYRGSVDLSFMYNDNDVWIKIDSDRNQYIECQVGNLDFSPIF